MQTENILAAIDEQIQQLQKARALLTGDEASAGRGVRRGRPKGPAAKTTTKVPVPKRGHRTMSAEGKARIAAAQKARWAAQKKMAEPANPEPRKSTGKPRAASKKAASAKKTAPQESRPATETPTIEA